MAALMAVNKDAIFSEAQMNYRASSKLYSDQKRTPAVSQKFISFVMNFEFIFIIISFPTSVPCHAQAGEARATSRNRPNDP